MWKAPHYGAPFHGNAFVRPGAKQEDDEPHINDPEQILAYLEELEGPGVPAVTIQPANNPKVAPILVRVDGVFEQKGACKLVFAQRLPKGLTPKIR